MELLRAGRITLLFCFLSSYMLDFFMRVQNSNSAGKVMKKYKCDTCEFCQNYFVLGNGRRYYCNHKDMPEWEPGIAYTLGTSYACSCGHEKHKTLKQMRTETPQCCPLLKKG